MSVKFSKLHKKKKISNLQPPSIIGSHTKHGPFYSRCIHYKPAIGKIEHRIEIMVYGRFFWVEVDPADITPQS
jgi:hypothetical protein